MLTLESYEQSNGFSVITADELYFINGGSGPHPVLEGFGNKLISFSQNIDGLAGASSAAGEVAQALGSASKWTSFGAFAQLVSCGAYALGNVMVWTAQNDSGDVQSAMNRYYDHH